MVLFILICKRQVIFKSSSFMQMQAPWPCGQQALGVGEGRCQSSLLLRAGGSFKFRVDRRRGPGAHGRAAVTALRAKEKPHPYAPARAVPAAATRHPPGRPAGRPAGH